MSRALPSDAWARETFGEAKLGDFRRGERLVTLAASLSAAAGASPAKASGTAAALEGAYRFLRNDSVDPEAIASAGFGATAVEAAGIRTLVAVEDTTTLTYRHSVVDELGDLGGNAKSNARGYFVHSALMLDAETGETVGLADQQYWVREEGKRGRALHRDKRKYEDKESFKWQRTSERLRAVLGSKTMLATISVCDREADIYQYLLYKLGHQERFVVRAARDRILAVESDDPNERQLFAVMASAPDFGVLSVEVPQRGGRSARTAELTVRALRVRLHRGRHTDRRLPNLEANVVLAREENPPKGAQPLLWVLLTTEPIATFEDVARILRLYRLRWRIEEFHKAWKSGAGVEERRLQTARNLQRIAVILAFVAVRLLQLREISEAAPETPCDSVLPKAHWQVLWASIERKPLPKASPTLKWALQALGRLGGWKDTKRNGRVGWDTLWDGWFRLQERLEGYRLATDLAAHHE